MRCLPIDLAKAYDFVDYAIFINKRKALNIDGNIISWLVSFWIGRDEYTKLGALAGWYHSGSGVISTPSGVVSFWIERDQYTKLSGIILDRA